MGGGALAWQAQSLAGPMADNLWEALRTVHGGQFMAHIDTVELVQHPDHAGTWALRVYLDDGCVSDYLLEGTDPRYPIPSGRLRQVGFPSWPPPA
ncbi:MAG: hypothetical protein HY321_02815 [Armatimonadetes bacterium]|nr:hypothetical protein [Armatimonadota bacterium]